MSISIRDPKIQRIGAIVVLGLGVLYCYFLTDIAPFTYKAGAAELEELSAQYRKLSSDLTKARQTINSLPYLEKESRLLHQKWNRAKTLIPGEQETASLLRAVTLLGDQSGVEFLLFKPLPVAPTEHHTEHPVEVKVAGGYHEIGTFLSELANMERVLTLTGLKIEAPKKNETQEPAVASFVAKTFTLGSTSVSGAEGTTAAATEAGQETARGRGIAKQVNKAKQTVTNKLDNLKKGESDDE
jgi:type IV pilus assembly protein PilO